MAGCCVGGFLPDLESPRTDWTLACPSCSRVLAELGIDMGHIKTKLLAIVDPRSSVNMEVVQDGDLFGPLLICLALGFVLLLRGQVHFGERAGVLRRQGSSHGVRHGCSFARRTRRDSPDDPCATSTSAVCVRAR